MNPLIERWPSLREHVPPVELGTWPTKVEPLKETHSQGGSPIWVKREDCSSLRFGGNKVRKLEFLLGGSTNPVITFGALGSHHVLATAIHAQSCGRSCIGVLVPQPMTDHHEQVHDLLKIYCSHLLYPNRPFVMLKEIIHSAFENMKNPSGQKGLTMIPPGASSALGTLGYVAAGLELATQVSRGKCPSPRRVYVALGTGGTAAGLAVGLALAGLKSEVVAVRVATRAVGNYAYLNMLARRSINLLTRAAIGITVPKLNIKIDHRFIGPGYAHVTREAHDAVEYCQRVGVSLDTTYTGKAFAALLTDRRAEPNIGPLLFMNTLGSIDHLGSKERN